MPDRNKTDPAIAIVIPAAGFGKRMHSDIAKQFMVVGGKSVLAHSVDKMLAWAQHYQHSVSLMVALSANSKLPDDVHNVHTCPGGQERADSVANALAALEKIGKFDWVMVHDAARPLVAIADVEKLYQGVKTDAVGGILAEKVTATVKRTTLTDSGPEITATLPRDDLWLAQTPQLFRFALLQRALSAEHTLLTDEASAIEALGLAPKIIAGSRDNLKITTTDDWQAVQRYFQAD